MTAALAISPAALAVLDQAACGLLRTDGDGLIQLVNMTFCRWVGYERDELIGKRRLQDLLTVGGRIFHQTHWVPLLQMQKSVSEVKFDLRLRDGKTLPMVMNAIRHSEDGIYDEIAVFVARDRDRYEKELLRTSQSLEAALADARHHEEAAKDRALFAEQMVGIVSHDLRTPLTTIQLSATLLGRSALTPKQSGTVETIGRATKRAKRLINDLLDFTEARIGSGLKVSLSGVDLHHIIGECVGELELAYPDRKLIHTRRGDGACEADGDRLSQLLGNLVGNAIAYGEPGSPVCITSSVEMDTFAVSVYNNGTPIPEEMQTSIFKPMTRGNAARAARGVGLGLFIVSEIAKAHHGSIEVVSDEGGTTFTVAMPRTSAAPVY